MLKYIKAAPSHECANAVKIPPLKHETSHSISVRVMWLSTEQTSMSVPSWQCLYLPQNNWEPRASPPLSELHLLLTQVSAHPHSHCSQGLKSALDVSHSAYWIHHVPWKVFNPLTQCKMDKNILNKFKKCECAHLWNHKKVCKHWRFWLSVSPLQKSLCVSFPICLADLACLIPTAYWWHKMVSQAWDFFRLTEPHWVDVYITLPTGKLDIQLKSEMKKISVPQQLHTDPTNGVF